MIVTSSRVKTFLGLADTCQASGLLTVGQLYEVKVKGATGNFANVGAASIEVGTHFYATGTTPTAWGGTILYIVGETVEAQIDALIPVIEADYERIRNKPFLRFRATSVLASKQLSGITVPDENALNLVCATGAIAGIFEKLARGMRCEGTGISGAVDAFDALNYTIDLDTAATASAEDVLCTCYPAGSDYTAALMIGYNLYKRHGLKSESSGGYSYSEEEMVEGYPKSITGMIERHVSFA